MKRIVKTPKHIYQDALYVTEKELKYWISRLKTDNRPNWVKNKIRMCERYIRELHSELEQLNGH